MAKKGKRGNHNISSKENSIKKISINTGFSELKEETRHGVFSIIFFVIALFFILASLDKAGPVGNTLYEILTRMFGVGYFLAPTLFILLAVSFLRGGRPHFVASNFFGSVVFLLSGLGLIHLSFSNGANDAGGIVGKAVVYPFLSFFGEVYSFIFLSALFIISIIVMFDARPKLEHFAFWRWLGKESDEEEPEEEDETSDGPYDEIEEEEAPATKEPVLAKMLGGDRKKKEILPAAEEIFIKPSGLRMLAEEFSPPPLSLLEKDKGKPGVGDIKANANIIKRTLQNFGIDVEMDEISIGPTVTRYALKPAEGVKLSRIVGLQNDLALALAAHPIRIEAPIPGKSLVGIEIPNTTKATVGLASLFGDDKFSQSGKPLLVALGRGVSGKANFGNVAKMPHLLIAGTTGSGKSVTIHTLITSLLYRSSPEDLKMILVDPKRVELTLYNKIPHLLTPVITDAKKAILALKWAAKEMDRRYDILEAETVRDIGSYHENVVVPAYQAAISKKGKGEEFTELPEKMPYIVIVIDELADIMATYPRELESAIVRLAQMSRAVGIHLIVSTQRPSVNVITGLIKANIPSRLALQVSSQIDSRTILDTGGAEKLLGAGDMLYLSGDMSKPERMQSAYITEDEVKRVVKFLADRYRDMLPDEIDISNGTVSVNKSIFESSVDDEELPDDDDLYEDAREAVVKAGKASSSYLQRKLKVGYARAARLIDMLEERGVIGPGDGAKPREVMIKDEIGATDETEEDAV
ncbi:MAG: DNA translocase FtsK 4TM domain-containing protein [Candidatus Paceibacterota bacterium]|jgi:S-DNA-T family DNA segregation ATPase FtsK/SpoIIIE